LLGKRTRDAVVQFRQANGLGDSDTIDDDLIAALTAKLAPLSVTVADN
jgi:hypothetical protein